MKKEMQKLLYLSVVLSVGLGVTGCQSRQASPRDEILNRSAEIMSHKAKGKSYVFYRETEDGRETYVHNQYMTPDNRPVTEHLIDRPDGTFTFTRETNAGMGGEMQIRQPQLRPIFPNFTERKLWQMKQEMSRH